MITDMKTHKKIAVGSRIEALGQLKPGWFDGKNGATPTEEACSLATSVFHDLIDNHSDLNEFSINATVAGGIVAEWNARSWDIQVVFSPDGKKVDGMGLKPGENKNTMKSFKTRTPTGLAQEIVIWLQSIWAAEETPPETT